MAPLRIRVFQPRLILSINRGIPVASERLLEVIGWTESVSDAASVTGLEALVEALALQEEQTSGMVVQGYAEQLALGELAIVVVGARSDLQETLPPLVEAAATSWAQREGVGEALQVTEAAAAVVGALQHAAEALVWQESCLDSAWTNRVEVAAEMLALAEAITAKYATAAAGAETPVLAEACTDVAALAGGVLTEAPTFAEALTVRMQVQENRSEAFGLAELGLERMDHLEGGPLVETEVDWLTPAGSGQHWTEALSEVIPLQGTVPGTDVMVEVLGLSENRVDQLALTLAFAEALALSESRTDASGAEHHWVENLSEYLPLAGGSYEEHLSELIPLGS